MLQLRAFRWMIVAALAGLLPATMLSGHAARHALEGAALVELAKQAEQLAAALRLPNPPALPPGAVLYAPDGEAFAGDPGLIDHLAGLDLPGDASGTLPTAATPSQIKGLLALEPLRAEDGTLLGSLALWRPAVDIEAQLASIVFGGLRNGLLLLLLGLPAAWIGTRLLLAPIAAACSASAALLDRLREADTAAEEADQPLDATPVLTEGIAGADAEIAAMARAAAAMIVQVDGTAAAMAQAELSGAEAAPP